MDRRAILVDVDLTVVDISPNWVRWLNEVTGTSKDPYQIAGYRNVNYNLTHYWKEELDEMGVDGFDFWRKDDIYDNATPYPFCVDVLRMLSEDGWLVRFVSQIKGSHNRSKAYFLKKYFPFHEAYVATKEKWCVNGDVIIDDRNSHLSRMPPNVKLVRKVSPFTQDVEVSGRGVLDYSWTMGVAPLSAFMDEPKRRVYY